MLGVAQKLLAPYLHVKYTRWASARLDRKMCRDGAYWLFILGLNNSGTTVLSKTLETHPEIRALPAEGHALTSAFPRPDLLGVGRLWSSRMDIFRWDVAHDPAPALQAKKDWTALYSKKKGIMLEKSPPNTVRSLWLQKNFFPSRFLSIIRNPYAVCEGITRRKKYTIRQSALHWNAANKCLLEDFRQLENHFLIKYEDMVGDSKKVFVDIQNFLQLKTPFNLNDVNNVSAHSFEGVTIGLKNLNEESIGRLSNFDIHDINEICGDLMRTLGYPLR